jgi:hypothetical protein
VTTKTSCWPVLATAAALLCGAPTTALAQFDHLLCQKIKDPTPKATYTVGINEVLSCLLKAPAKLECHRVFKSGVSPRPPGGGPIVDLNVGKFLCYKIKCPNVLNGTDSVTDQFGSRTVQDGTAKLFCTPASASGAFLDGGV